MGVAAYQRGSLVISRGLGFDLEATYKPEPRPDGWGDKAKARALSCAAGVLSAANRHGMEPPSVEMLTDVVVMKAKVGKKTAAMAAAMAIEETRRTA